MRTTMKPMNTKTTLEGFMKKMNVVVPAEAGTQFANTPLKTRINAWIPAIAGMTEYAFAGMTAKALAVLVCSTLIATASAVAAGKGTSGGQFLRVGAGARGPAMGGAYSAIADDATAIYWNPAGMAMAEKRELAVSYNAYFKDTASQFLGYVHPTERGSFGLGVTMLGVSDIEKRSATGGDADVADLGDFNTQDMAVSLGYANKMAMGRGRMDYGLALKYISSDLETHSANTGALDMGAIYHFNEDRKGLSASLAVLNLGGELKFDQEGDPLPLNIKPGVAYHMMFEKMGSLTAVLEADMLVHDGVSYVEPGLEWQVHPMLALRGGYQIGRDEGAGSGATMGAGFRLMNIGIDYAFVPFGDLGDGHRLSIGYRF